MQEIERDAPVDTPLPDSKTGTHHQDPAPFGARYTKALGDPQLQPNLLAFQRSWRQKRDTAFGGYAENPLRADHEPEDADGQGHGLAPATPGDAEFQALRDRLKA